MTGYHTPIMLKECIRGLNLKSGGVYVDGTLGGGGHSHAILSAPEQIGRLIAFDKDIQAVEHSRLRLKEFGQRAVILNTDFKNAKAELAKLGVDGVDGVLLDLGISSRQIDDATRGFSYMKDARLDMRMDVGQNLTAHDIVNGYDYKDLMRIIKTYGEESFASRIAANIVISRPINTTLELAEIIKRSVPVKAAIKSGHPAKKTFQALRIEVNNELSGLDKAIDDFVDMLKPGGRLAVISFHSLEDRIIKLAIKRHSENCVCDKSLPVCVCGHTAKLEAVNKKPLTAADDEMKHNSRAASAKLRIAARL